MIESTNLRGVCDIFLRYTREIHRKSTPKDPNFLKISIACGKIEQFIESIFPSATTKTVRQLRLEAERAERAAQALTPEEQKELRTVYAGVAVVWIVMFAVMSFIAWLFGARFDLFFEDAKRLFSQFLRGGVVEGDPGRAEL